MRRKNDGNPQLCRRSLLQHVAVVAGVTTLFAGAGAARAADEKMSQKDAEYQPTPKNGQTCRACEQFAPPTGCKIVVGKVSPQGWCQFFAAKTGK